MRGISFLLTCAISLGLLQSCSLNWSPPQLTITFRQNDSPRGGRSLSALDHFALVVSGSGAVDNTRSADVGGKSLACLNLTGQATFPLTLSQLTSGVSLSLATGTYRFSVIGFDSSGLASPATIAELYANSPLLQEYLVAQTTVDTAQSSTVTLNSTYNSGTTANLFAECTSPATVLHGLISTSGTISYLKGLGSQWTLTLVGDTATASKGALAVDVNGVAHVSYGFPAGSDGVRYATNQSGSFVSTEVGSPTETLGKDYSSLALSSDNKLYLATNRTLAATADARLYERASTFWVGTTILSGLLAFMPQLDLQAGPSRTLGLFATIQNSGSALYIAQRSASLVWSDRSLSTAGATACPAGISSPSGAIDAQGFAHVVYVCDNTGLKVIGYATDRSGSWTTSQLSPGSDGSFSRVRLALDGNGGMHAIYQHSTGALKYQASSVSTGTWGAESSPLSGFFNISGGFAIAAPHADEIHIIVLRDHSSVGRLTYLTNASGSWVETVTPDFYSSTAEILNGFYAR